MSSLDAFIPSEVLTALVVDKLRKKLVAGDVILRLDASGKDSISIPTLSEGSVSSYTKNSTITYSAADAASQILQINQNYSYARSVDKVDTDSAMQNVVVKIVDDASFQLAKQADTYLLQTVMSDGAITVGGSTVRALGTSTTPISVVIDDSDHLSGVLDYLGRMSQRLNEVDVATEGRWAIVPPWFHSYLSISKVLETNGSVDANDVYSNGKVGRALGFDIRVSNNLTNAITAGSHIYAGSYDAVAFADSMADPVQIIDLQTTHGYGVKGLYRYGGKAIQGAALAKGIVSQA